MNVEWKEIERIIKDQISINNDLLRISLEKTNDFGVVAAKRAVSELSYVLGRIEIYKTSSDLNTMKEGAA